MIACDGVWDVLGNKDAGCEALRVLRGLDYRGRSRPQRRSREAKRVAAAGRPARERHGLSAIVPASERMGLERPEHEDRREWGSARSAARRLVELAFKMGSHDNVTCVVVDLRRPLGAGAGGGSS